ncbi:MAG: TetR/AcrR family transcriptional regulator [Marmoricola sp.]
MPKQRDWLTGSERHEAAVKTIRAAARKQLLDRGPDRFTAEAVARRAGCSRATLYRIVGGKKALLDGLLAEAALDISSQIREAVKDLEGAERVSEAIIVGLRTLRADPPIHDWVRQTVVSSDFLQNSASLAGLAAGWLDTSDAEGPGSTFAGEWIVRVYLSLIAWPGPDEETEARLVREFVEPGFRSSQTRSAVPS